jgi:ABC-2 type transport system ATP-binding protein
MLERPALEALDISKRYGERPALAAASLVARPGQMHGLLGPNGAGKTTLMRVCLGLVSRDSGTVHLLDRSLDHPGGPVPDGVAGFVETPGFYPYLSGRQNLTLLSRLDGIGAGVTTDRVEHALEVVGLAAQADSRVGGYSAGMRQRLGVAGALLREPRLLLLDEPTSSLDPAGARAIRAVMRRLADDGAAVVLSSHDMDEVESLCDAVTVLHEGMVVFSGLLEELRSLVPGALWRIRTSEDGSARDVAFGRGLTLSTFSSDGWLEVTASVEQMDGYVIALGNAGIAVRGLERRTRSLESMFLQLTAATGEKGTVR